MSRTPSPVSAAVIAAAMRSVLVPSRPSSVPPAGITRAPPAIWPTSSAAPSARPSAVGDEDDAYHWVSTVPFSRMKIGQCRRGCCDASSRSGGADPAGAGLGYAAPGRIGDLRAGRRAQGDGVHDAAHAGAARAGRAGGGGGQIRARARPCCSWATRTWTVRSCARGRRRGPTCWPARPARRSGSGCCRAATSWSCTTRFARTTWSRSWRSAPPSHGTRARSDTRSWPASTRRPRRCCWPAPAQRLTGKTLTDPESLRQSLAMTRERGYAAEDQEATLGDAGLAAPVFDWSGRPVGALGPRRAGRTAADGGPAGATRRRGAFDRPRVVA